MISLGSRAEVVFILNVKRRDLGLTCSSVGLCPGTLGVVAGVVTTVVAVGTFSIGLFENREDNFEKNEERPAWLSAEVSWDVRAV